MGAGLTAAVALTACSSGTTGSGSTTDSASSSASSSTAAAAPSSSTTMTSQAPSSSSSAPAAPNNAALSAPKLADAATAQLKAASAFRIHGSVLDGKDKLNLDLHYGANSSLGSVTISGHAIQVTESAGIDYLKGDASFWRFASKAGGASSQQIDTVVARVADKWVKTTGNSSLETIGQFASRQKFTSENDTDESKATRGPRKTVQGVPAVSFVDPKDHSVVYVHATGPAIPLLVDNKKNGSFTFTDWNKPYTAPAPPADQIVQLPS